MTTPNHSSGGTSGPNSGNGSSADTAMEGETNAYGGISGGSSGSSGSGSASARTSGPDDVSFGRTGPSVATGGTDYSRVSAGQDQGGGAMSSAKDTVKRGMDSAENAVEQLQQKATELTSRLISNIDVDDLTQKLEQQVREHPARTLLVALGAGFLIGRSAKGR